MDFEKIKGYMPYIILTVFAFFVQYHFFVTPKDLAETRREIMVEVKAEYASKKDTDFLREQFGDMKTKIDKIYDKMLGSDKK